MSRLSTLEAPANIGLTVLPRVLTVSVLCIVWWIIGTSRSFKGAGKSQGKSYLKGLLVLYLYEVHTNMLYPHDLLLSLGQIDGSTEGVRGDLGILQSTYRVRLLSRRYCTVSPIRPARQAMCSHGAAQLLAILGTLNMQYCAVLVVDTTTVQYLCPPLHYRSPSSRCPGTEHEQRKNLGRGVRYYNTEKRPERRFHELRSA